MASLKPIKDVKGKKEKPMKVYQIFLDGIDKTGKDLIRSYIFYLGKGRYICNARGIISMRVYSKLYNRPYEYDDKCQKNCFNVLLTVDKEDWEVRCKSTNEPLTNYEVESDMFLDEYKMLKAKGYACAIYNTSFTTPYNIAKDILRMIGSIEWKKQK